MDKAARANVRRAQHVERDAVEYVRFAHEALVKREPVHDPFEDDGSGNDHVLAPLRHRREPAPLFARHRRESAADVRDVRAR